MFVTWVLELRRVFESDVSKMGEQTAPDSHSSLKPLIKGSLNQGKGNLKIVGNLWIGVFMRRALLYHWLRGSPKPAVAHVSSVVSWSLPEGKERIIY